MNAEDIRGLLESVRDGRLQVDDAARQLHQVGEADLGFARVDLHRRSRCGFPEVIFCEGKTPAWAEGVVRRLVEAGQDCLATRLNGAQAEHLARCFPEAQIDLQSRTFWLPHPSTQLEVKGHVLVATAGTSDIPVAQEAVVTARALRTEVELAVDIGVAGIHRLLNQRERLAWADCIVVAAGMDGALPSVIGGLVDVPVIALPTSIGYGTAFAGVAPLLTAPNSCAANVVVVNIDSGFKAGYVAAMIARRAMPRT